MFFFLFNPIALGSIIVQICLCKRERETFVVMVASNPFFVFKKMTIKDTDLDRNLSYVGKKRMKNNRIVSIGARQNSKRRRWTTSSWSSQMAIIITSIGKSCCSNVANVFFVFSLNYTAHHNRFGSSKLLWRLRRWSVRRTKKMGKCPMFITNWTLDNNQSHVFHCI